MMTAFYSGATGMKAHDTGLSTISNNIANVNTIGFKQQYTLFQDMMSQLLSPGASWPQNVNQLGLGAQAAATRTVFTEGSFEPGSAVTDLAIGGRGYFQVSDGEDLFYTRAGNFRFDQDGWLRTSGDMTVTGMAMANGHVTGEAAPIRIDPNDPAVAKSPGKATSNLTAAFNLPKTSTDNSADEVDPYFSLLGQWDGAVTRGKPADTIDDPSAPLPSGAYSDKQTLTVTDSNGKSRNLTVYFDGVSTELTGRDTTYEYIVAADPTDTVAADGIPTKNSGALMAGTITFSSSGEMIGMTAFTPAGTENPEAPLAQWVPAPLVNGKPQFSVAFDGGPAQSIALDMGLSSSTNLWANAPASAAAVGADPALLGTLDNPAKSEYVSKTSADTTKAATLKLDQDGWAEGSFSNLEITPDGVVRVLYSNAQATDLFTIPLFRFSSEDGLRREGGNLYAATNESGETQWGVPGTSNYGELQVKQLETSNVDMSREMVALIMMQRGFQMNSKTITTADQLLQKALELKRN